MVDYCNEYTEKLQEAAKDMAHSIELLCQAIKEMPNMDDDPEKAYEHFTYEIVERRLQAERSIHYYYKNESKFSND